MRIVRSWRGTDLSLPYVYGGFSVHDELDLFVQAGHAVAGTANCDIYPARHVALGNSNGSIHYCRSADLVLLGGAVKNISKTVRTFAVILRGQLMRHDKLDAMLRSTEAP